MSANKRWRRHKMCDVHFGTGFLLATGDDQAATDRCFRDPAKVADLQALA